MADPMLSGWLGPEALRKTTKTKYLHHVYTSALGEESHLQKM